MMEHQIKSSFQIDLIRSCVGPGRVWSIFLNFGRIKKNSISETCLFRIPLLGKSPIFTALLLRENHDFPSSGFQNKTSFLFETRQPRTHVRVLGWERQRTSGYGSPQRSVEQRKYAPYFVETKYFIPSRNNCCCSHPNTRIGIFSVDWFQIDTKFYFGNHWKENRDFHVTTVQWKPWIITSWEYAKLDISNLVKKEFP